jgi:hypothetical protein
MIGKNRIIDYFFTFLVTTLILFSFTLSGNAQTLYTCAKGGENPSPYLRTIDPNTGATLTMTEMTLAGHTVRGCNGMAKDPITGVCWMLVNVDSAAPRILATLDETTGVATEVGTTLESERFAGLAFDPLGTLFGVTGDQSGLATPKLYTLSKNDASASLFLVLGNGDNGEAIAMNTRKGNQLMYHASGVGPFNVDQIFEKINLLSKSVTQITYSGDIGSNGLDEVASLVFQSDDHLLASDSRDDLLLASDTSLQLFSISTDGVASFIGDTDFVYKGMAFDCGVADPITQVPTLSEWGLIAMAGILGIVGFMVIRRRRVTA